MTFDLLAPAYPWVKAVHLMAVIAWMAGLFYLPRLFVYHSQVAVGGEQDALFKVMERRLIRAIMNPAMIVAWALGITLVLTPGVVELDGRLVAREIRLRARHDLVPPPSQPGPEGDGTRRTAADRALLAGDERGADPADGGRSS